MPQYSDLLDDLSEKFQAYKDEVTRMESVCSTTLLVLEKKEQKLNELHLIIERIDNVCDADDLNNEEKISRIKDLCQRF